MNTSIGCQALTAIVGSDTPLTLDQVHGACSRASDKTLVAVALKRLMREQKVVATRERPDDQLLFASALASDNTATQERAR